MRTTSTCWCNGWTKGADPSYLQYLDNANELTKLTRSSSFPDDNLAVKRRAWREKIGKVPRGKPLTMRCLCLQSYLQKSPLSSHGTHRVC
ncbi:demethylmenaquinone methyltransferase [Anopheles sinensis]|uniref:Demethylmenaquinone methyltransferase n=1 Tax=Anopheles sinensis TaxID=74873 RepID=A0A084VRQ0_ANOSI|nr:demethylmenaquinone methyltransferase [Anopheles sinensis]